LATCILNAQQPKVDFKFNPVVSSNAHFGRYTLTPDVQIEGIAVNGNGEVTFVVSHLPMGKSFGSAVMTPDRVIALTYDHVGGTKTLLDISGVALAIDDQRHVYYESSFQDGETTRLGVFKDKEFQFVVNGPGAADDFTVTPDGRITAKAGIVPTTAAPTASQSETKPRNPAQQRLGNGNGLPGIFSSSTLSQQMRERIAKRYGIALPPNPMAQAPQPPQQQRPQPVPQASRPDYPPQAPAKPAAACALPAFPLPSDWVIGAQVKAPLTSSVFDAPGAKQRAYESPLFGHMGLPFRTILYSDCVSQVIILGDGLLRGKFEFWTANGLLTYTRPDGFLELPGFGGKALPASLARRDAPIQINRKGQIVFLANLDSEGYAILLATPTGR
jgi:hypothetical protein